MGMNREQAINYLFYSGFSEEQINTIEQAFKQEPTNDLVVDCISRQAVIDLMMQKWGENFSGDDAMQESIDAIREMPSVTPQEPKIVPIAEIKYDKDKLKELMNKAVLTVTHKSQRGHWITKPYVYGVTYCSECDFELKIDDTNYCPNCGAKMESEDNNDIH